MIAAFAHQYVVLKNFKSRKDYQPTVSSQHYLTYHHPISIDMLYRIFHFCSIQDNIRYMIKVVFLQCFNSTRGGRTRGHQLACYQMLVLQVFTKPLNHIGTVMSLTGMNRLLLASTCCSSMAWHSDLTQSCFGVLQSCPTHKSYQVLCLQTGILIG